CRLSCCARFVKIKIILRAASQTRPIRQVDKEYPERRVCETSGTVPNVCAIRLEEVAEGRISRKSNCRRGRIFRETFHLPFCHPCGVNRSHHIARSGGLADSTLRLLSVNPSDWGQGRVSGQYSPNKSEPDRARAFQAGCSTHPQGEPLS